MPERRAAIGIDATPLASGHATRGIGRHVSRIFEAAMESDPGWAAEELGTLLVRGQAAPLPGVTWRTLRSPIRPQDLDAFVAPIADRLAIHRRPPRRWHHTDPLTPASPLPADRTIVFAYDIIGVQDADRWAAMPGHRRAAYGRYLALMREARGVTVSLVSTGAVIAATLGIPADRIAVVPPYVRSIGRNRPGGVPVTPVDGPRPFVFVGVLEPHKRPELAIDTIAVLAARGEPATLAFIDARPAIAQAALEQRAAQRGVPDRIEFLGRLDDDALNALYGRSTLLATSWVEGFGQPPVEAILAGGRVVATPIPSYLETVGGLATFAADSTAEALADAAQAATRAPDDAARETLAQRFGAKPATDALRAAYERFE